MTDCSKCLRTDVKCCFTCKKDADKCKVWHHCGSDCPAHESRIKTNADSIRSMSDEELAEFLLKVNTANEQPCMIDGGNCKWEDYPTRDKGCKDCFLEYLRKEVKGSE